MATITLKVDTIADQINGRSGNDSLFGGADKDTLLGGNDNDELVGQDGNDLEEIREAVALDGGKGDDLLKGGKGSDLEEIREAVRLIGRNGNDSLNGGGQNDKLLGGNGNDVLRGGKGKDVLTGGAGRDTFVLVNRSGADKITDFEDGFDKLKLTGNLTFGKLTIVDTGNDTEIFRGKQLLATLVGIDERKIYYSFS